MAIAVRFVSVVVALACLAFATFTLFAPRARSYAYVPAPGVQHTAAALTFGSHTPTALFVGDSYTAGALGITSLETFPGQTCNALGLTCNLDGEGSTGYQSDGHKLSRRFSPYQGRLKDDAKLYEADLVVVSGGRNDIGEPGSEFVAARTYFRSVRQAYPKARLVVVEPFWTSRTPPVLVRRLRADVRRAAHSVGAVYLPSNGWLKKGSVAYDGVHPNREGHRQLAERLTTALRASGVLEQLAGS
jgi:lysophospholipase L1-like esterase